MRSMTMAVGLTFLFATSAVAGDFYGGYAAYQQKDYYSAYKEWSDAASQGDHKSQYRLGLMFESGIGVPNVTGVAVALFVSAADQGHKGAVRRLLGLADQGNTRAAGWLKANPDKVAEVQPSLKKPKAVQETEDAKEDATPDSNNLGGLDFLKQLMK